MKQTAIMVTSILVSLIGCEAVDDQNNPVGTMSHSLAVCDLGDGSQMTMASLAVAIGEELGEIDPLGQLEIGSGINGERMVLQPDACPDGCPRTEGLLDLQDATLDDFPQNTFSATRYRTELVAKYQEQIAKETQDPNVALPGEHQLRYVEELDLGGCGMHTVFDVLEPDCDDDCAPYAGDVSSLENRLWAFGGDGNPFIDFRTDGTQIMIDPDNSDTGVVSTDGAVIECDYTTLCRVWDRQWVRDGCCECPGVIMGNWERYTRNNNYAICVAQ